MKKSKILFWLLYQLYKKKFKKNIAERVALTEELNRQLIEKWPLIKNEKRTEIHINNLSLSVIQKQPPPGHLPSHQMQTSSLSQAAICCNKHLRMRTSCRAPLPVGCF